MAPGEPPLISVITVVLNDEAGLRKTAESVFRQSYPNLEYIVIDGNSQDGTREAIWELHAQSRISRWTSEPDLGIADANNKGFKVASGEWINFLSAKDTFVGPWVLERIASHFPLAPIITGYARFGSSTIPPWKLTNEQALDVRSYLSWESSFVHRSVYESVGSFDTSYQYRMDYEFWLRALSTFRFHLLDEILVDYAEGGHSSGNRWQFLKEEIQANKRHLSKPFVPNLRLRLNQFRLLGLVRRFRRPRPPGAPADWSNRQTRQG